MVGNFKPNMEKREDWKSICITQNEAEAFYHYIKNKGCFISTFYVDGDKKQYYQVYEQQNCINVETEAPLYHQVLQQEQFELYKLMQLIQSKGGTVIDLNTDAVACYFPDNKVPFEFDGINVIGHYWENNNQEYKYKLEDKPDDKKLVKFPK